MAFLRLGLTSFGGPIAHVGYFREALVVQRRWVSEQVFSELLSLTQFLPGPASSQLGFSLGLIRAGWAGAIAAFVAFTLPSALLLMLFARLETLLSGDIGQAALHGLKLVAVCVVAQALLSMARQLTPDAARICIALGSAALALLLDTSWSQLLAIIAAGGAGLLMCHAPAPAQQTVLPGNRKLAAVLLALFGLLLIVSLTLDTGRVLPDAVAGFYRAGALVFGGGHVVLPLLEQSVVGPGLLSQEQFLSGYGAAQAVPGPMFSVAAYLGARLGGSLGAVTCLLAVFLPGFLILGAALPLWSRLTVDSRLRSAFAGVNAGVVGLLAAAFCTPVCSEGINAPLDVVIAALGLLLARAKIAGPWASLWVVLWCVAASLARHALLAYIPEAAFAAS